MKNTSQIIREDCVNGYYTIVQNDLIRDTDNLSLSAVGLLTYIISLPTDWIIYKQQIEHKLVTTGLSKPSEFKRAWKECEKAGYIQTKRIRTSEGKFKWDYIVRQCPMRDVDLVKKTTDGKTMHGKSTGGKTMHGKLTDIRSKEERSKEERNKEYTNKQSTRDSITQVAQVGNSDIKSMSYEDVVSKFGLNSKEADYWLKN